MAGKILLSNWWLFCGILVILMQVGFILFETGCVRKINQPGIAIKNILMLFASILGFTLFGYRLLYGEVFAWGIVGNYFAPGSRDYGLSWQFCQTGYAIITATIISGAIAGRTQLRANVIAAFVVTAFVYPTVAHWVWGGGWLVTVWQAHDFAGSGTVHFVGGIAAAMGAWVAGPRGQRAYKNPGEKFKKLGEILPLRLDKTKPPLGPRELSFASFGIVFLTIGWMGFNGGNIDSEAGLELNEEGDSLVAIYFLATACAATGGLFSVTIFDALRFRRGPGSFLIDPFGSLAGAMGGMVAITAVVDLIPNIYYGFIVGLAGGIATYLTSRFVRLFLELDDPVDAIAVHAGGGIAGVLLVAGFPGEHNFWGQLIFLASSGLFTGVIMLFLFLLLNDLDSLRCSKWDEYRGLSFGSKFVTFDPTPEARPRGKIQRRPPLPKNIPPPFDPRSIPRRIRTIITFLVATSVVLSPGYKPIWEFFRGLILQ